MTVEATLQATGVRLVLRAEGYQFPQFETGSDANWLTCDIQVDIQDQRATQDHATFRAHLQPTLMTVELKDFADQLRALDEKPASRAVLEHIEECIGLTITSDAERTTVEGFVEEHTAARLDFGPAEIDRTSLQRAAEQLEAIVDAFPVRGNLHDPPERPIVSATCQSWNDDEGWGVLVSDQVPGELFAHFAHIDGDGYRELRPGERVQIEWEPFPSGQDGYYYRATRVRRENPA